ncbi:MAG: hypothetical protein ACTSWY_02175 [Promethearchaeota archaeon]
MDENEKKMSEDEKQNFFENFKNTIAGAILVKENIPKWKKFLQKKTTVSFKLQVYEDEFIFCTLKIGDGKYLMEMESRESDSADYDFQIRATPEDLFYFANNNYSTLKMSFTKNEFGEPRWKIKKGGRHLFTLLKFSSLLVYD